MKFTLLLIFLCTAVAMNAQNTKTANATGTPNAKTDSLKQAALESAALLDPRIRQFSLTYTNQTYGTIRGKNKDGQEMYNGKLSSSQINMNMNIPVVQNRKNSLVLSVGAIHQFFNTKDMVDNASQPLDYDIDEYMPMTSLGISYSRPVRLFGKDIYTVVSASGIFNSSMSSYQYTLMGAATVPLIKKQYTNFTVGAVAMWNPASPIPFFLMFSYYHKFKSSNLDLIVGLPTVALRKELTRKASLSIRGDMGGSNSLFKMESAVSGFSQNLTYSTFDIKGGLLFEYRLTQKLVVSAGGGINVPMRNRLLENNKTIGNYLIENKYKTTPYLQVGISMLPFWKELGL